MSTAMRMVLAQITIKLFQFLEESLSGDTAAL